MDLCVGCKACKRECPTGVDVYRMKIEFLSAYREHRGLSLRDRLIAFLPRYAPWAARFSLLANSVNLGWPGRLLRESLLGFTARRRLPSWRGRPFRGAADRARTGPEVVLLVDTFNTYFEPETAEAAVNVLDAAGYRVVTPEPVSGGRPLCCGRTFLNAGLVDEAKTEARRVIDTLRPHVERGVPIVGLEPSCLLTLRDEFAAMLPGEETGELAGQAMLFEEFLAAENHAGRLNLPLKPLPQERLLLHGHCHQKAFDQVSSVAEVLRLIPGAEVELIESGCCGMAGSFGYEAEHYETSMKMAELDLLPRVREANGEALIVADGTSCRTQIRHGAGCDALHVARVLELALSSG